LRKLQSQGVHHITIAGADRQTSIDFWEGVLGMPSRASLSDDRSPKDPYDQTGRETWLQTP
jgi:catechol 2,3-dioxygenase-like lactoylglutathione lyase family enzyme